jgi:hypothetical protein
MCPLSWDQKLIRIGHSAISIKYKTVFSSIELCTYRACRKSKLGGSSVNMWCHRRVTSSIDACSKTIRSTIPWQRCTIPWQQMCCTHRNSNLVPRRLGTIKNIIVNIERKNWTALTRVCLKQRCYPERFMFIIKNNKPYSIVCLFYFSHWRMEWQQVGYQSLSFR